MSARPIADSGSSEVRPMTVPRFVDAKRSGRKLSVLTAYDFLWAGLLDAAGVDAILVGDSLGMVVQGKPTTLPVTLDEIIYHAEMVVRAVKRALVIVDMPFMTLSAQPRAGHGKCRRDHQANRGQRGEARGGGATRRRRSRPCRRPTFPSWPTSASSPSRCSSWEATRFSATKSSSWPTPVPPRSAGAFAIVLECIPRGIARTITAELSIPTIGIGAGPGCDGQVLVTQDMLGLTGGFHPKFVKPFANLAEQAAKAVGQYIAEVQSGTFPDDAHSHG